jgi:hypothetical protein
MRHVVSGRSYRDDANESGIMGHAFSVAASASCPWAMQEKRAKLGSWPTGAYLTYVIATAPPGGVSVPINVPVGP